MINLDTDVEFQNVLFELQTLESIKTDEIEYGTIEVYFENEQGCEGSYERELPELAASALKQLKSLEARAKELETFILNLWNEEDASEFIEAMDVMVKKIKGGEL